MQTYQITILLKDGPTKGKIGNGLVELSGKMFLDDTHLDVSIQDRVLLKVKDFLLDNSHLTIGDKAVSVALPGPGISSEGRPEIWIKNAEKAELDALLDLLQKWSRHESFMLKGKPVPIIFEREVL